MDKKVNLKQIASDALDMALTPDTISSLQKHDERYHPDGYVEGMFCKFRQAMERGDSADKIDEAEQEEAAAKAEVARIIKRYEDVGRLILTGTDDEAKYEAVLSDYGFKKVDKDYQRAYDIIYNASEQYDAYGDEEGDAVGELKALVLRVDHEISALKNGGISKKQAQLNEVPENPNTNQNATPSVKASKKQDVNDIKEIRDYLEQCARLVNGRTGNIKAIQASSRWALLQDVVGGKLGKEIGDRLSEMAIGDDVAIVKAAKKLKPIYDNLIQSAKNGWSIRPGMIVSEEDLFEEDAEEK